MTSRYAHLIAVAIAITACSVPTYAQQGDADGANAVLPWAFVLNDPASGNADVPDPDEVVTVPGSSVSMPRSAINLSNGPPDWHPNSHPPMPELVATGGGEGVVACGYCHLPNGQGKPENASLAGQPYEYIVQQMADWRNGLRKTGEPRMGPPAFMERIGLAATDEQARVAAEYFSSIDFKPWIRVVETDMVPETRFAGWIHKVIEGGGTEPIGTRVVETPEDLHRTELRDDASSFIAYVPTGAIARGEDLVTTGGPDPTATVRWGGSDVGRDDDRLLQLRARHRRTVGILTSRLLAVRKYGHLALPPQPANRSLPPERTITRSSGI